MNKDLDIYSKVFFTHKFMEDWIFTYLNATKDILLTRSEFKRDKDVKMTAFALFFFHCGMTKKDIAKEYATYEQYVANYISAFNKARPAMYFEILRSLAPYMPPKEKEPCRNTVR